MTPTVAEPGAPPAVELRRVEMTYANGTRALLPFDLAVARGEFVTLLGASGCGKSTLLKIVAGLLAPTAGQVLHDGRPVDAGRAGPGREARLGFVFQEPTLMPWARVRANVRLPLDLAGVPRARGDALAQAALEGVGLGAFGDARPRELSGGMQMRASIARSLVTEPTLLLMDEPFGALDEITRNRLDDDLLSLWRERGLTVIFVTHSIHEAVFLSGRVVVMGARPGRIVEQVPIDAPQPRPAAFRVSSDFARQALALHECLLRASGETGGDGDGALVPAPAAGRSAGVAAERGRGGIPG